MLAPVLIRSRPEPSIDPFLTPGTLPHTCREPPRLSVAVPVLEDTVSFGQAIAAWFRPCQRFHAAAGKPTEKMATVDVVDRRQAVRACWSLLAERQLFGRPRCPDIEGEDGGSERQGFRDSSSDRPRHQVAASVNRSRMPTLAMPVAAGNGLCVVKHRALTLQNSTRSMTYGADQLRNHAPDNAQLSRIAWSRNRRWPAAQQSRPSTASSPRPDCPTTTDASLPCPRSTTAPILPLARSSRADNILCIQARHIVANDNTARCRKHVLKIPARPARPPARPAPCHPIDRHLARPRLAPIRRSNKPSSSFS